MGVARKTARQYKLLSRSVLVVVVVVDWLVGFVFPVCKTENILVYIKNFLNEHF